MPERDTTRINERIRVPEVRVIGDDGAQIGILTIDEALKMAQDRDLDLVEVAPEAKPPVCRILDYSKYKYEQAQKVKQARKHQTQITIREIKFRPKIAAHDYATKKGHVERFLLGKDKVKITIMFRGREVTHPKRGVMILDRLADELEELASIEQRPNLEGRNMTMVLGPSKAVVAGEITKQSWKDGAEARAKGEVVDIDLEADEVEGGEAEPAAEVAAEPAAADEPDAEPAAADEPAGEAAAAEPAGAEPAAADEPAVQAAAESEASPDAAESPAS